MAAMVGVNGPIRHEIGMNAGTGAMAPYNQANATIGRAYGLLSQNLQGGSVPDDTYMGSLGNWYALSATFAENEERSPWEPFQVQHGCAKDDSTVSVFFGGWYTQAGFGPRETWQEKLKHCIAAAEHNFAPLLVLDPIVARGFVERGFDTKRKLSEWISENCLLPAREYWDNQWVQTLSHPLAVAGVEPYATRLAAQPDELISVFTPDDVKIVVAGGETQGAWRMFGASYRGKGTFSVDAWR